MGESKSFSSVYAPTKITIEGVEYELAKRDRKWLREINKLDERANANQVNETEYQYELTRLLIVASAEVIDGFAVENVVAANAQILADFTRQQKERALAAGAAGDGEPKNPESPGGAPAA